MLWLELLLCTLKTNCQISRGVAESKIKNQLRLCQASIARLDGVGIAVQNGDLCRHRKFFRICQICIAEFIAIDKNFKSGNVAAYGFKFDKRVETETIKNKDSLVFTNKFLSFFGFAVGTFVSEWTLAGSVVAVASIFTDGCFAGIFLAAR